MTSHVFFGNMGAMLKIRLQRVGRKNNSAFRIVTVDSKRGPKSGDNVEILGSYNPHLNKVQVKSDRVKHWMSVGAQVSDTVHNLLINEKIIEGKKINVLPKKSPIVKEPTEEEKKAEEAKSESPAEGGEEATVEKAKEEEPKTEEVKEETPKTEEAKEEQEAPKEEEKVEEPKAEAEVKEEPETPKEEEHKEEEDFKEDEKKVE